MGEAKSGEAAAGGRPEARASARVALGLWVLLLDAWFKGPLLGGRGGRLAVLLFAGGLVAVGLHALLASVRRAPTDRALVGIGLAVLVLATLVRLPALANPASLLSSDSAVAGIIAQELRAGEGPAPVYAPGFPYEGTLKPHLTAALGALLPRAGTPFLYILSSHLLYLVWIVAVMALAHGTAGRGGAAVAGLYMAVSPRFLAAFSLNNVGQYPEVNALGALALAFLAGGGSLVPGFLLGLALWQQLLGVYFVLTVAVAVLATPSLRHPRALADGLVGFLAGSYPIWIWNAGHQWATFDLFRRGGKHPAERLSGLPEQLRQTVFVSLPKLFGVTDLGWSGGMAAAAALVLPALVVALLWSRRREILERRGRSPVFLAGVLFAVVLGVFAASKFSHRGAQRPRYLTPLYTPVAIALGWAAVGLTRRAPPAGLAMVFAVLVLDGAGLAPWLRGRALAEARDRAFVDGLAGLGVRTGYSGFWIAPKYTFLSEGRFILSGELGPDVSWVHEGHTLRVRQQGPDAYVTNTAPLGDLLARRLDALGVSYQRTTLVFPVFHHLSRRVRLEEISGYDDGEGQPASEIDEPDK